MRTATETFTAGVARDDPASGTRRFRIDGFDVEVIETASALDAVSYEWRAIEQSSNHAAVFQSFPLLQIWARHFCTGSDTGGLHITIVRKDGRAILILPLQVSGMSLMRIARIAGDPITQYSEILVDPAFATRETLQVAFNAARAAGIAAIVFRRVRDDSNLLALAGPILRAPSNRSEAPFVDLSRFADFPAFLASRSRKLRHSLRNRRKHLSKEGEFRFEIVRGAEARSAVAEALDLKRKWLVQRGAISTAFVDPATRECLLDLAESSSSGAVIERLVVRGETAAIRFGFKYRGTHFAFMGAYASAFRHASPGKLLTEFCFSGFQERNFSRFDFLPPGGPHKSEWCSDAIGVTDYTLPLTGMGQIYARGYQERLRPALRAVWQRTPETLRSLAAALFLRV